MPSLMRNVTLSYFNGRAVAFYRQAGRYTNFPRFQGAPPDHVRVESSSCCFPTFPRELVGVFHLPKDSGKFPKRRWEMLIGEKRVPFDTLVPFIPGSLHHPMYFPPKYKMAAQLLLVNEC